MNKLLTIWIPTYRRPECLAQLIENISLCGLFDLASVVISDNDPIDHPDILAAIHKARSEGNCIDYVQNKSNLTAGVNFLRAFEWATTPWLMIVGDDDRFSSDSLDSIGSLLTTLDSNVIAVKFDSSLFGRQQTLRADCLKHYLDRLDSASYPDAFNNLCLISNWIFQPLPYLQHVGKAYLGYSSKISHLFPVFAACRSNNMKIQFLSLQPIIHGTFENDSWPKAATWSEMVITLSSFCGFVNRQDRKALLALVLHSDWRRYVAKCFRVHSFYRNKKLGISPWRIHFQLSFLSFYYFLAFLITFPLLLLPIRWLPRACRQQLGDPGSIERW
jgi:glycosyltransferase involved in cell wall biosynthesis